MPKTLDRLATTLINDPRDTVFVELMVTCSSIIVFAGVLFWMGTFPVWLGGLYLAFWGAVLVDRFTLMLHCTSHRPLFRKKYGYLNHVIPWVLGPFLGQSPETYFSHHMGMHHGEGNLPGDLSSTMKYQRDNPLHWLRYFTRFFFLAILELSLYHGRKGRKKLMRKTLLGEGCMWLLLGVSMWLRPQAALFVFVIPFVTMRVLMMAGNWGQHAFVDPDEPDNDFKNSITCINTRYNRRCFNDGYHIIHHLKPSMHYTEMDKEFEANQEAYGKQDAIVFSGVDFFGVWVALMLHRYRSLARAYVRLPGAPERSEDELVAMFKHRLAPIRGWQAAARSPSADFSGAGVAAAAKS